MPKFNMLDINETRPDGYLGIIGQILYEVVSKEIHESFLFCMYLGSFTLLFTLDLFASDPFKIMLSKGGFLWKL